MTDPVAIVFVLCAAALWASTFGYLLALQCVALLKPQSPSRCRDLPRIAVVVPVLNEERLIRDKLVNLCASDYPADRLRIVVVDGGSADRTAGLVALAIRENLPVQLLQLAGASGKAAQINHALAHLDQEIVVVTDADARLEPSCLRELVCVLAADPRTALVGAAVRPAAVLPEERAYWWFLNRLWWLEGQALGSAMVSAACYALRRAQAPSLPDDVHCDDAFMMMAMGSRGSRVRLCRAAKATELRVPRSRVELLEFRFRRGRGYLRELCRATPTAGAHPGWRVTRRVRQYHFRATPALAAVLAVLTLTLPAAGRGEWVAAVLGVFAVSAAAVFGPAMLDASRRPSWLWPRRAAAVVGAAALTWYSLVRIGVCATTDRSGGGCG